MPKTQTSSSYDHLVRGDVIAALRQYRDLLKAKGQPVKVAAVEYCIVIVKRLSNIQ